MSQRIDQLNSLVQQEVSKILLRELELPKECLVTVTRVSVADDAESAKIWISVLPDGRSEEVLAIIKKNIIDIQQTLNKRLFMKFVPKLTFTLDHSAEHAESITHVLDTLTERDLGNDQPQSTDSSR